jgi:hypothetical protein
MKISFLLRPGTLAPPPATAASAVICIASPKSHSGAVQYRVAGIDVSCASGYFGAKQDSTQMRIVLMATGCFLIVLILAFLGFGAWYVSVWGFSPLGLFPAYIVGLMICVAIGLVIWYNWPGKPSA